MADARWLVPADLFAHIYDASSRGDETNSACQRTAATRELQNEPNVRRETGKE
jgi:hypothetical protein